MLVNGSLIFEFNYVVCFWFDLVHLCLWSCFVLNYLFADFWFAMLSLVGLLRFFIWFIYVVFLLSFCLLVGCYLIVLCDFWLTIWVVYFMGNCLVSLLVVYCYLFAFWCVFVLVSIFGYFLVKVGLVVAHGLTVDFNFRVLVISLLLRIFLLVCLPFEFWWRFVY